MAAAKRLQGVAHRTPVLSSAPRMSSWARACSSSARTCSVLAPSSFAGPITRLAQFTPEQRKGGALAFSSGNHAQAIAQAAQLLDMPALIVMPEDAPASKMAATWHGAQVVTYNRFTEDREAIAQRLATERGMTLIAYNHAM